ncbi:MAG: sigma 54-interacting transcriptional regulator, partial [Firmicutes bacterium]|nr:sigma 54-interacting transcriptional regulator [Bacillota bacterium]
ATNRRLEDMVEEKTFRRDLYYRLNVFPINIPSLEERQEDIPALIAHFMEQYNEKFGMDKYMDSDAVEYLKNRSWEGNIRELENVMQRLMISSRTDSITMVDVLKELDDSIAGTMAINAAKKVSEEERVNLTQMVEAFEKELVRAAWDEYGSTRKAAKALGISQTQFVRKKTKYDLDREENPTG